MSHEITIRSTGQAEMAFVGETPWHGLGKRLTESATPAEWRRESGLDFVIRRAKVRYPTHPSAANDPSQWQTIEDRHVLFRSDTGEHLGIVSDRYQVVQPAEVLDFFLRMVAELGIRLHTAGTLFGGRRMWALAKIGEDVVLTKGDNIGSYLLISTACDGSMVTEVRRTMIRVVCQNTLGAARFDKAVPELKIRHSRKFNAAAAAAELGLAHESFAAATEQMRRLAAVQVSFAEAQDYVRALLRKSEPAQAAESASPFGALLAGAARLPDAEPRRPEQAAQVLSREHPGEAKILDLFSGLGRGATLPGSAGTAWGLLNAVTEYVDHHARGKTASHRLNSAWFGAGDDLKNAAVAAAQERFL